MCGKVAPQGEAGGCSLCMQLGEAGVCSSRSDSNSVSLCERDCTVDVGLQSERYFFLWCGDQRITASYIIDLYVVWHPHATVHSKLVQDHRNSPL